MRHLSSQHAVLISEQALCPYLDCRLNFNFVDTPRQRAIHVINHMASTIETVTVNVVASIATHHQCPHRCNSISTSRLAMDHHTQVCPHARGPTQKPELSVHRWLTTLVPLDVLQHIATTAPAISPPTMHSSDEEYDDDDHMVLESYSTSSSVEWDDESSLSGGTSLSVPQRPAMAW